MTRAWIWRELTLSRWRSNPFQMFSTLILAIWAVLQIGGTTQGTVLGNEIERHAQILVSATNLLGASICLVGLHMRDIRSALWVEVIGYVSLLGSLGLWIYLVAISSRWLNTSPGYGLAVAFCLSGTFRTGQIFMLKRAERRVETLNRMVASHIDDHDSEEDGDD